MKILAVLALSAFAISLSGCANLCERRESWFASHCKGTDVTYSHDDTCEMMLDRCDDAHVSEFKAYVMCLESQKMCSLETIGSCQQQHPSGVNLMCEAH